VTDEEKKEKRKQKRCFDFLVKTGFFRDTHDNIGIPEIFMRDITPEDDVYINGICVQIGIRE